MNGFLPGQYPRGVTWSSWGNISRKWIFKGGEIVSSEHQFLNYVRHQIVDCPNFPDYSYLLYMSCSKRTVIGETAVPFVGRIFPVAEVHCLTKIYRELTSEVKTTMFLLLLPFCYSKVYVIFKLVKFFCSSIWPHQIKCHGLSCHRVSRSE